MTLKLDVVAYSSPGTAPVQIPSRLPPCPDILFYEPVFFPALALRFAPLDGSGA